MVSLNTYCRELISLVLSNLASHSRRDFNRESSRLDRLWLRKHNSRARRSENGRNLHFDTRQRTSKGKLTVAGN